ncbi:MAG: hypothetical protein A3K19_16410 [Lentisphaerae bacterium RIFOXYB12_FULL_65_16]|nr:MAG: hypothetical protein A3K18_32840 [Lentisphaerae bacterium RIFOXYA12_64_32]OGV89026.1 MAG: hypothetical protein A3K19_16410 [Lentisphaerae bacterium RIFOXYB12_FULL_65_16]
MRILLANTFFFPAIGGIENYLLNVGRCLVRMGYEVTALVSRHAPGLPAQERIEGIEVLRYQRPDSRPPMNLLDPVRQVWASQRAAANLLAARTFDVAWVRDVFSLAGVMSCACRPRVTYIQATACPVYLRAAVHHRARTASGRAFRRLSGWCEQNYLGWLERRLLHRCELRVVLSEAKRQEITRFYGFDANLYQVIPAGVDTERFRPADSDEKRTLRERLQIPQDAFVFLYVGRSSREKNPQGVVEAFRLLSGAAPKALVMLGPFDTGFVVGTRAGVFPGVVLFPGEIPEPAEYYQASDVFVLPSLSEGFGQVLLEAMASGLPCVAYQCPEGSHVLATNEVITEGVTGLLCEYDQPAALADTMERFAVTPGLAGKMGSAARRFCLTDRDWLNVTERLLAVRSG